MFRVLLTLLAVGLAVYALSDCATSDEHDRSGIPKGLWIVMIIFLPFVGPLAWILVSRTQRSRQAGPSSAGVRTRGSRRGPAGPIAPDDDPDFLWRLEQQRRREARGEGSGPTAGPASPGPRDEDQGSSGTTDGAPDAPSSGSTD
ncbi:PLD nuclease N-terminal domain-containing protein [Oerskovia turbata]